MPPALQAVAISKRFGAVVALSDGRLTVEPGEIHALMGANGSGKSTLSKIIAGTVARNEGTLTLFGETVTLDSPREAEKRGVALFYQELSLVPQLSVADNIFLGHEQTGAGGFRDSRAARAATQALIDRFGAVAGVGLEPDAIVSRLSADQRQIVEILKVLARRPKLIIFDEATAALDRRQVDVFFAILRELKAEGVSAIFISHRLDEVFAICDRITVMRNGAFVADYDTAATTREAIVHAMVGDVPVYGRRPHTPRPSGEAARLSVSGVSARALYDVSFTLAPGEILGLGGLQGQGQGAVLRGLFGEEPFRAGAITLDGKPLTIRKPSDAVHAGLAYVSGDRGRDAALHGRSIFENAAAATFVRERLRLVFPNALKGRFREAAASLNTKYAGLEAPIGSLSGGNQQKIFIARWLANRSPVLLLNDPTKGIDLAAKADFFELVRKLAADGTSILFYSSEDAELLSLCDRILVFNSGTVAADLSGERMTAFELTNAAYGKAA